MSDRVGSDARRRDVIAMTILAVGAAVAAYGYLGLHVMATRPIARVAGQTALERAMSYNVVMYAGLGIVLRGIGAVIWSFWRFRRPAQPPR